MANIRYFKMNKVVAVAETLFLKTMGIQNGAFMGDAGKGLW